MAYSTPTDSKTASIHRLLIQGGPNSGKTHAVCSTWPEPLAIVVCPGEQGDATIPRGNPNITPFIWSEDPIEKLSSANVVIAVDTLVAEILGGKHGTFKSLCIDGYHKYYAYVLDWQSGGSLFKGESLGNPDDPYSSARIYNRAREYARYRVQRVNAAPMENVVWTCWDGREADDPTKGFKSKTHVFPGLPGQAAKEFMGEFGLVVHSRINWGIRVLPDPARVPKGMKPTDVNRFEAKWQLIPEGDVWGASVKAPIEVIERLPLYCAQSYPVLKKLLEDAWASTRSGEP